MIISYNFKDYAKIKIIEKICDDKTEKGPGKVHYLLQVNGKKR